MVEKDSVATVEKQQVTERQETPIVLESTRLSPMVQKDTGLSGEKQHKEIEQEISVVTELTPHTQVVRQGSESSLEQQVPNGQETLAVVKSSPSEPLRPSTPEVPAISRKPNGLSLFNGHDELSEDNILAFFDEAGNQISISSEEDSETFTVDRGKVISSGIDKAFKEKPVSTGHELDKLSNPQHQESAPSISPLPPSSILLKQKLDSFHVQNMEYIKQHSEEIQLWYKGLRVV